MALFLGILPCKGEVGFDDINVKTADGPTPAGESEIVEAKPTVIPKERMREIIDIDISKAANRDLADDAAGDGRGGWTDEGPQRDMRNMPRGDHLAGRRALPHPARPEGGHRRPGKPPPGSDIVKEATIPVGRKIEALYILHAGAFLARERKMSFEVIANYKDGSTAVPVLASRTAGGLAGRAGARLRRAWRQPLHHGGLDGASVGRQGERHDLSQRAHPRPHQTRRADRVDHHSRRRERSGPDPGLDRRHPVVMAGEHGRQRTRRGGPQSRWQSSSSAPRHSSSVMSVGCMQNHQQLSSSASIRQAPCRVNAGVGFILLPTQPCGQRLLHLMGPLCQQQVIPVELAIRSALAGLLRRLDCRGCGHPLVGIALQGQDGKPGVGGMRIGPRDENQSGNLGRLVACVWSVKLTTTRLKAEPLRAKTRVVPWS